MNTELGRKVLDHVTVHRDQFDMGIWGEPDTECGTVACLAGWAMLLSGYRLGYGRKGSYFARPDGTPIPDGTDGDEAARLLDLSCEERYGSGEDECSLFTAPDDDIAIERFRALVDAAEASLLAAEEADR